jgi:DNA-binding transcriptional ArsR family regulator
MRNKRMDALFPKTRQEVLAALLVSPARRWFISDLARHIGVPPSSLQRELFSLTDTGLFLREVDGRRVYYRANELHPFFTELQAMFFKSVGVADIVSTALEPFLSRIDVAFILGSTARGERRDASDIDLLLVGNVGLSDVAVPFREVEFRLGARIDVVQYSVDEFRDKRRQNNHFLTTIMQDKKIFLKGSDSELADIAGERKTEDTHHEFARAE